MEGGLVYWSGEVFIEASAGFGPALLFDEIVILAWQGLCGVFMW